MCRILATGLGALQSDHIRVVGGFNCVNCDESGQLCEPNEVIDGAIKLKPFGPNSM